MQAARTGIFTTVFHAGILSLLIVSGIVVQSTAVHAQDKEEIKSTDAASKAKPEDGTFKVYWKDGIRFKSADERHSIKFGGRLQLDQAFWDDGAITNSPDRLEQATEMRRARLYLSGTIYERVIFKTQYDFAGSAKDGTGKAIPGVAGFKDAYVGVNKIPYIGTLTIGNQYEPFGLQALTSSKYISLMERSSIESLTPGRSFGLRMGNSHFDNKMQWSAGVFRPANSIGATSGNGQYSLTGRASGVVYQQDDMLVHLGANLRYAKIDGDAKFSSRPESHLTSKFVSGSVADADSQLSYGLEAAAVAGSLHASAEYIGIRVLDEAGTSGHIFGLYGQVGYFLTGETRAYKASSGSFSRTKPKQNAFVDGGKGAWELALRVSHLNANDSGLGLSGGQMTTYTAGMNWYLNPNARVMLNYVRANLKDVDDANIVQARLAIDF